MSFLIQIIGLANGQPSGGAEGQYVVEYTPDGHDGRGDLVLTPDPWKAKSYPSMKAAMAELGRTSRTHPTRPWDGKPNRPLTAFTVSIIKET